MIQISKHQLKQNQNVSQSRFSTEELANHRAKRHELGERCRLIFEKIRPQLIKDYENWFIAIEADTESYLIASQLDKLIKQIKEQYPSNDEVKMTIFRLNQVGSCGQI